MARKKRGDTLVEDEAPTPSKKKRETIPEEELFQDGRAWYVVHTYSGYENKVKANLEHRIESMGMEDKIFQVLVPMEDEIEIRQGQRHTVQKKVYPGYVLVEMILDPDSWFVVRNTPGVTSFVGGANIPGVRSEPIPLDENEVKQILRHMGVETPKYRVAFTKGQSVRVTDGPFAEAKELIGGWALMDVRDKDEALEWAKRFLRIAGEGESYVRQTFGPEDFDASAGGPPSA